MIVAERGEMGSVLLLGTQLGEVLGLAWPEPRYAIADMHCSPGLILC